ncbi:MAG: hypothetical protein R3325_08710, partial [Thermoanaerobaculia bacterium]|nr:hypothetical protein [Thermoanaerobaculia bacterium]
MPDLEVSLLGIFGLCWVTALAQVLAGYPWAGAVPHDLYSLYALAAFGGWLAGNVLVTRRAGRSRIQRRRLLLVYLFAPLGPLYLLHTLGPALLRHQTPLAP